MTGIRDLLPLKMLMAVVVAIAAAVFGAIATPQQASAAPFSCTTTTSYISLVDSSGGSTQTQLAQQLFDGNGVPYTQNIGAAQPLHYNALGFNHVDGYMYAIARQGQNNTGTPRLMRIHSDGSTEDRGLLSGMSGQFYYQSGVISSDGATLYVGTSGNMTTMYAINLTTAQVTPIPLDDTLVYIGDLVQSNAYLWTIERAGSLVRIDPATGETLRVTTSGLVDTTDQPWFAVWSYGDGTFGAMQAVTGDLLRFRINAQTSNAPTAERIAMTKSSLAINGDGTSCIATAATDLSVTVTAPAEVTPDATFTVDYTVRNNGPVDSSGFTFAVRLLEEFSNYTTTTPGCSIANGWLVCNNDPPFLNGDERVITITMRAPSNEVCGQHNGAIHPNDPDTNMTNNSASASTCVRVAATTTDPTTPADPSNPTGVGAPQTGVLGLNSGARIVAVLGLVAVGIGVLAVQKARA